MALMDFIKKQFIDIIEWTEDGDGTLAWRYPMADNEIQYGASLTVRESVSSVWPDCSDCCRLVTRGGVLADHLKGCKRSFGFHCLT